MGAALEAAGIGIPAIAVSLETLIEHHYSLSNEVNFAAAAYFTHFFSGIMLSKKMPPDVDALKIDIPIDATPDTPWEITRISNVRLFEAVKPQRKSLHDPGIFGYRFAPDWQTAEPGSDVHAVRINKHVSVTPLSLDLTSRIDLLKFDRGLRT